MKLIQFSRASLLAASTIVAMWAAGCSDDEATTGGEGGTDAGAAGKATGGKASGGGTSTGGKANGGTTSAGGTTSNGGSTSVGGGATTGGTANGGTTSTGGTATAGKAGSGTAGAAGAGCGTTPSTVNQTWTFSGTPLPTGWSTETGVAVTTVTNAACPSGCAAVAITVPAGTTDTGWGGSTQVKYDFANLTNLYGATITASVALEVPTANVAGTSLQLFDQGGGTDGWAWGTSTDMPQTQRGVTTQLFTMELKPTQNASTGHCASSVKRIGLQVQRSANSAAAYNTVLYIREVKITPPGGTGGTGGAAGAAGATSTAGNAGTAGGGGTAGATSSAGSAGTVSSAGTTSSAGSAGTGQAAGNAGVAGSP